MLSISILIALSVLLQLELKKILGIKLVKSQDNYARVQSQYDGLSRQNSRLKQINSDLDKSVSGIIALYDITEEICKSLNLDEIFAAFKEKINRYIQVGDCKFLKPGTDLSGYANYVVLPLKIDHSIIGYLAADDIKETDKDKFQILSQQFILGAKRAILYQKVQELAITDSLSRVFTRRYFFERFAQELERSKKFKYNFSLLIIDVDRFKYFNDNYGHLVGDAIIKEVSKIAKDNIRQIDIIGRYGGDELAIILSETDKKQAEFAAERIRKNIENKDIKIYDETLKVTISIGISSFPEDAKSPQLIIDKADIALYKAKQAGRNRFCSYAKD